MARAVRTRSELLIDDGHSRPEDVLLSPSVQPRALGADRGEQIAPRSVPVRVCRKETAHAALKRVGADEIVELLQDGWRLVVYDRAVVALRLIEILEHLPDGRRPARCVDRIRRRLVPQVEGLP